MYIKSGSPEMSRLLAKLLKLLNEPNVLIHLWPLLKCSKQVPLKTRACMCAQQQKGVLKEDNKYSQQTETKQNQGKPLVNHGHESWLPEKVIVPYKTCGCSCNLMFICFLVMHFLGCMPGTVYSHPGVIR